MKRLAQMYAAILVVLVLWAWCVDITLLHSGREHLLPDLLLASATLPSSLLLSPLYDQWPGFFDLPFTQLSWLTACAVFQAVAVFLFCRRTRRDGKP